LFVTAVLALALLLPEAVDSWPGDPAVKAGIAAARWPALALLMWLALATLYRFAPCRRKSQWRWASGGAAVATALWVLGSAGLSYVVANFSSGSAAFGALSAVLVMQTWFYVAALAVLLGARLNAEAEHQTTGGGAE
jgi:membrane protein